MSVELIRIDRAEWQSEARKYSDYNYRQLWEYGVSCAERTGSKSEHVGIRHEGRVIGLADVRIKEIPFIKTGIAYVSAGPMVRLGGGSGADSQSMCLEGLIAEYVRKRKMLLRISPPLGDEAGNKQWELTCEQQGFRRNPRLMMYRTILLDINKPIDEIRKNLKQKWRNALNKAEKQEVSIRGGREGQLFSDFCELYDSLVSRKGFDVNLDARFYHQVQAGLDESDRLYVCNAYVGDRAVAGYVSSMLGDTCVSLLAATSDVGLKNNASYLVLWHTIQMAQSKGCKWNDQGGIDQEKNPGVYHFKSGVGGIEVTSPGPYEYYPNSWSKLIVTAAEKAYHILRGKH